MMKKKILFVSSLNDSYLIPFKVFLFSLVRHNPVPFRYKVYHTETLSKQSINELSYLFSFLTFEKVTDPFYSEVEEQYMCLLAFNEVNEDQIIFFDCDMLCMGSIEPLLGVASGFAAVLELPFRLPFRKSFKCHKLFLSFNSGVFTLNLKHLDENAYNELYCLAKEREKYRESCRLKGKKVPNLKDQPVLNRYFSGKLIECLPDVYNSRKKLFAHKKYNLEDVVILHYWTSKAMGST